MLETFKRRNFVNRTAEKRREISRCAAKQRREKESDVFTELYSTVPIVEEPKVSHVDRIAVLRLAASFCRFRQVADKVLNPPRASLLEDDYESMFLSEMLNETKTGDVLSGFLLVVDSQASIIYISPNVSRSLGLTQTDLIGHNLYEFVKEEDIAEMRGTFNRTQLNSLPNKIFIRMKSVLGARGRNLNLRSALFKTMAITVSKHHVDLGQRQNLLFDKKSAKLAARHQHHLQHRSLIQQIIKQGSAQLGSPFNSNNNSGHNSDVDLDVDVEHQDSMGAQGDEDAGSHTSTSSSNSANHNQGRPSSVGPSGSGSGSGLTLGSGLTPKSTGATIIHQQRRLTANDGDYFFLYGSVINQYGNIETQNTNAFVTRHSMDMKFSYCHERLSDYLGYDIKSLMGLSFYSMIHPQDLVHLKADFKELYQKHQVSTGVYRLMAKSGGYIWLTTEASVVSQGNRSGRGQHIVCIHQVVSNPENHEILADVQQHLSTLLCHLQGQGQAQSQVAGSAGHQAFVGALGGAQPVRPDLNLNLNRKLYLGGAAASSATAAAVNGGGAGFKCYESIIGPAPAAGPISVGHSYSAQSQPERLLDRAPLVAAGGDVGNLPFWDTDESSMYNYDRWLFRDSSGIKSSSSTAPHTPNSNSSALSMDESSGNVRSSAVKRGSVIGNGGTIFNFGGNKPTTPAEDLAKQSPGAKSPPDLLASDQSQRARGGADNGRPMANREAGSTDGSTVQSGNCRTQAYGGLGFSTSSNQTTADAGAATAAGGGAASCGAGAGAAGFAADSSPESMSAVVPADSLGSASAQVGSNGDLYPAVSDAGISIAKDLTDKLDDLTLLAPFVDTGELVTLDLVPSDLDFPLDFGDFKDLTDDLFSLDKKAKPAFSTNHSAASRSFSSNHDTSFDNGNNQSAIDYWPFGANAPIRPVNQGPPPSFYESYAGAANLSNWPPLITCPMMMTTNQNPANSLPQAHPDFFNASSLLMNNDNSSSFKNTDLSIFEHQSPIKLAQSTIDTVLSSSMPECKPIITYCNSNTNSESNETTNSVLGNGSSHVTSPSSGAPTLDNVGIGGGAIEAISRPASCMGGDHVTRVSTPSSSCNPIGRSIVEEAGHGYARQLNEAGTPAPFLFNQYGTSSFGGASSVISGPGSNNSHSHVSSGKGPMSVGGIRTSTPFLNSAHQSSSCSLWPNGNNNQSQQTNLFKGGVSRKRHAPGSTHQRIRYKETAAGITAAAKKQHVQFAYQTGGTTVIGRKLNSSLVSTNGNLLGSSPSTNSIYPSCYQGGTNVVVKRGGIRASGKTISGVVTAPGPYTSCGLVNGVGGVNGLYQSKPTIGGGVFSHNGITASSSNPSLFNVVKRYPHVINGGVGGAIVGGLFPESTNWNQPASCASPASFFGNSASSPFPRQPQQQIIVTTTDPATTKIRYVKATFNSNHGNHHNNNNNNNNQNSQPPILSCNVNLNNIGGGNQQHHVTHTMENNDLCGRSPTVAKQPPLLPLAIC